MVNAMNSFAKSVMPIIRLPRWTFPRLFRAAPRRRRATIDLIHASPHLLRDIGLAEGCSVRRRQ
jgi:uncharacterized protein YjiS (DUF1127 family)